MSDKTVSKSRRRAISVELPCFYIVSCIVLIGIFLAMLYFRFQDRMVEEYSHIAEGATNLMAVELDGDKVDDYLEQNFEMEEYNEILARFYEIRDSYPDILYMYVYRLSPEGGTVIFDLNSIDGVEDAGTPGEFYEFSDLFMSHIDDLCAGKDVPGMIGPTEDGYMLTYCKPIYDSNGVLQCHACVDFSIDALRQEDAHFMFSILLLAGVAAAVIMTVGVLWSRRRIVDPLLRMAKATERFSYRTQAEHEENIRIMKSLSIRTGDEIEKLYHAFLSVMSQSLLYMQNLNAAEIDLQNKEQQLGQISIKAFRDALTSVGNKAAYNTQADDLNAAIQNGTAAFAIVMLDANNLKQINDLYGHEAGDSYIKGCCHIICDTFKRSPVYRVGGDEFVAVLTNHDFDARSELMETVQERFRSAYGRTDCEPWERYSMSIGMAEYIPQDTSVSDVLKRADAMMYAFKRNFKKQYGSYR